MNERMTSLQQDCLRALGLGHGYLDQKADDWMALQEAVRGCQACPLSKSRTKTVFGVGSLKARLMLIGEGPGYHEDQKGQPFVGRAGALLNQILQAMGWSREEVYIANTVKCRPPNNRDPLPEEVSACAHFLAAQIEYIQPTCLVALGRVAGHSLLGVNTPLKGLRGVAHEHPASGLPLYVTYHPAYLLRNPMDKREAYLDWQRIWQHLQ